jgi:hypothetical protein
MYSTIACPEQRFFNVCKRFIMMQVYAFINKKAMPYNKKLRLSVFFALTPLSSFLYSVRASLQCV